MLTSRRRPPSVQPRPLMSGRETWALCLPLPHRRRYLASRVCALKTQRGSREALGLPAPLGLQVLSRDEPPEEEDKQDEVI